MTHNPSLLPSPASRHLASVADVSEQFTAADYVCSKETATAVFLMVQLQRPLLVEGPPGVGKTELAKVLAQTTEAQLIRLQCYEGLDEAKALRIVRTALGRQTRNLCIVYNLVQVLRRRL